MSISRFFLASLAASLFLTGCSPVSGHRTVMLAPDSSPPLSLSTEVYFYPNQGQTPQQQDRDRYECYLWAVKQSGFDPSAPYLAPHQQVMVTPQPATGHDTAAGAFTGAVLGAAIGSPHSSGKGAILGAIAGAMLGAASDAARQEQAEQLQASYDRRGDQRYTELERQARRYRRAMGACLEGRGYSVR